MIPDGARYLVGLIGAEIGTSLSPQLHEREADELGLRYFYQLIDIGRLGLEAEDAGAAAVRSAPDGFPRPEHHPPVQADRGAAPRRAVPRSRRAGRGEHRRVRRRQDDRAQHRLLGLRGRVHPRAARRAAAARGDPRRRRRGEPRSPTRCCGWARSGSRSSRWSPPGPSGSPPPCAHSSRRTGSGRSTPAIWPRRWRDADGLVNATPVGMEPQAGMPLPEELLRPEMWVADIVYRPLETELLPACPCARLPHPVGRRHGGLPGRCRLPPVHRPRTRCRADVRPPGVAYRGPCNRSPGRGDGHPTDQITERTAMSPRRETSLRVAGGGPTRMQRSIATVSLSGTLEEKLTAAAQVGLRRGRDLRERPDRLPAPTRRGAAARRRPRPAHRALPAVPRLRGGTRRPACAQPAPRRAQVRGDGLARRVHDAGLLQRLARGHRRRRARRRAAAPAGRAGRGHGMRIAYEALAWGRHVNSYRHAWQLVERGRPPAAGHLPGQLPHPVPAP